MTVTNEQYAQYVKKAWIIYYALAVLLACLLVIFVARDHEEQFFYGIMTLAASYVFRPTERFMESKIHKYTGINKPDSE